MSRITVRLLGRGTQEYRTFENNLNRLMGQPGVNRQNVGAIYAGEQRSRIYAGDYMNAGSWMNSSGQLDAGKIGDNLRSWRMTHAQNVQNTVQGRMNRNGGGVSVPQNPIVEMVDTARAVQQAQAIEDKATYSWPDNLNIIEPEDFNAADPVDNGNGVQPPVGFMANRIVVLGADIVSVQRFEIMGRPIVHGTSSGIASQWKADSTANLELNLPLDTVPIIFAGTCLADGFIGITMPGFSKMPAARRG